MKTTQGDLLALAHDGVFDVIIHGCNCFCAMGAGIALAIKTQFPEAFEADLRTVKGDRAKLGMISTALIERNSRRFFVVNGYTQFHWRGQGVLADYDAIRAVMRRVKSEYSGQRIGYPKIGAGLARGDWETIASIIDEGLAGEDHCLVLFPA